MNTVLITGASRGIGASTAEVFASHNFNIALNYLENSDEALKVKSYLEEKYKVKVLLVKADVSDEAAVKKMCEEIKTTFGTINCLVNNAGIACDNDYIDKDIHEFKKVINTNLIGAFLVMKYASLIMDKGSIINVSSDNALFHGYKESMDYDASKAGVITLSHDFALALAPRIRVNVVAPGWVLTDMNKNLDPSFKKVQEDKCLLKRMGDVKEIANVIYFLASDDASFINDVVLPINGGVNNG